MMKKAVSSGFFGLLCALLLLSGTTGRADAAGAVNKTANPMKVNGKSVSVNESDIKNRSKYLDISKVIEFTKKAKGPVRYKKLSGNRKILVDPATGKITLMKGLGRGTYTVNVRVLAKGNNNYKKKNTDVKCTIQVYKKAGTSKRVSFKGKNYKLSLSDDFNTFNKNKWAFCPQIKRADLGGEWRNSCTGVKNGKLIITCKTAKNGTPISGGIRSTGKYEQTCGLYHIRFKAEKANGLWYAFWLLTDKMNDSSVGNGATDGAELDIIELVPYTGELEMSVHWDGYNKKHLKSKFEFVHVNDDFYGRYHELWYVWDKKGYRLYLDGTDKESLLFDFPGKKYGNGTCAVPCDLLISAEFGKWGGKIKKSQLPAHLYVDYVRVYKETV